MFLPNLEGGGAERAFVELANEFVQRELRVDFVLATRTGPYLSELAPAVRVVDLASTQWPVVLWKLAGYLRRTRPDATLSGLDLPNVVAVLASALAGTLSRCAVSQRAVLVSVWQMQFPRTWRLWLWLLGQTYRRARLVICNSTAAAAEVVAVLGVDERRCAVLHNWIDMDRIRSLASEPIQDEWLTDSAPPLLLSVGSLTPRKDIGTLLRAFAIVRRSRNCNLLILGEGGERKQLEAMIRQLGLDGSVRMPGFAANPFPWIARADVLLSTSLAEGCPNVIQQALACGTLVVATDCPGGTAELLEHARWGRLVATRDAAAIADAVLATLDDPDPPDGRLRARDFDRGRTADEYLRLLLPARAAAPRQDECTYSESQR